MDLATPIMDSMPPAGTRSPLPNDKWWRSGPLPEYALCFDPTDERYGWLCMETWNGRWMTVNKLTLEGLRHIQSKEPMQPYRGFVEQLIKARLAEQQRDEELKRIHHARRR